MKRIRFRSLLVVALASIATLFSAFASFSFGQKFRPPAVPLVVHDPYFSIWSPSDCLTDSETQHWTGEKHPLHMMIRLDDKAYRIMGAEPADVPAFEQKKISILPTTTVYHFENRDARVVLTFITPLLPYNLDWVSRPATYITVDILIKNKNISTAVLYFDAGAEIAVDKPDQPVQWSFLTVPETKTVKLGSVEQNILGKTGDNVRIDWGNLILSVPDLPVTTTTCPVHYDLQVGDGDKFRRSFVENGSFPEGFSLASPAVPQEDRVALASIFSLVDKKRYEIIQANFVLAYDDEYSIQYYGTKLKPWWKRDDKTTEEMIQETWSDVEGNIPKQIEPIFNQCRLFNSAAVSNEMLKVGGANYAKLCALAYRQAFGAQKIVADANGAPLMFSKENFSNGCIGTVDILYPCSPLLLYYSPPMLEASLEPILTYAASERWKFPFAPHDLGQYPCVNGQVYGGGETSEENQMPIEETANMLIMVAALAHIEENADYAARHWKILTSWAKYLKEKGLDPENQLCTDDFAGRLARNTNLSAKSIIALACYARLAETLNHTEIAAEYRSLAENRVQDWVRLADDGDHFRLTFDGANTWSMKYNLMWDKVLDLQLFPQEVFDKELAYYQTKMEKYGLPLDSRSLYTKSDWILWMAATIDQRKDFMKFIEPVVKFLNETPQRVPISDWYWTNSGEQKGFQARSVVGGFWAPMLRNKDFWQNQAQKAEKIDQTWAPLPSTLPETAKNSEKTSDSLIDESSSTQEE